MAPRTSVPPVDELRPSGDPLTFLAPAEPDPTTTETSPSPGPSDLPSPDLLQEEGWPSEADGSDAGDASETGPRSRTSSRGSSADDGIGDELFANLTRGLVQAGGEELHETLARDDAARAVGLWLTDEADQSNIGDPLARMINRHVSLGDVADDTDAGDAIAALVGLVVYGVRQFGAWRVARRLRRGAVTVETPEPADVAVG